MLKLIHIQKRYNLNYAKEADLQAPKQKMPLKSLLFKKSWILKVGFLVSQIIPDNQFQGT